MSEAADWHVYIVQCCDDSLYTGITNDLARRLSEHNRGTASRYTRCRLPVEYVYHETQESKGEALRREYAIKQLSREEKLSLVATHEMTNDN